MAIAIIDDSMTALVVLKQMTKNEYHLPAVLFPDPRAALEYLSETVSELIIVDCEMPDLDGIAVVECIRRIAIHQKTPILMVTCHADPETRLRALQAGVTDFLSKPVIPMEFKLRIQNLIGRSHDSPVSV